MDEEPPYEMRYSIDTPEPTPPSSPPQAVSIQTSLNEQAIADKVLIIAQSYKYNITILL